MVRGSEDRHVDSGNLAKIQHGVERPSMWSMYGQLLLQEQFAWRNEILEVRTVSSVSGTTGGRQPPICERSSVFLAVQTFHHFDDVV